MSSQVLRSRRVCLSAWSFVQSKDVLVDCHFLLQAVCQDSVKIQKKIKIKVLCVGSC